MTINDHLLRGLAPIPAPAWAVVDSEARERLTPLLTARRIVDWVGPGGWRHHVRPLGRTDTLDALPAGTTAAGVLARRRRVLLLTEVQVPFTIDRAEIGDIQRGSDNPQFDDLDRAARAAALIETRAVFHGWPEAGITGLIPSSSYPTVGLGTDVDQYPAIVAQTVDRMRRAGITGPYHLSVGPETYTRIIDTAEHGGYLLSDHLTRILGGQIVWAPGVDGAVVTSARGDDFLLDVGQDWSIGYTHHDADTIHLYLEESLTFHVAEPAAVHALA